MPRMIDTSSRTGALVLAINSVLVTHGVFGLTLRTIARESGISTGSMLHHFDRRERMLSVAAHRTGLAVLADIDGRILLEGVEAFVPGDDDGLLLTRAWLAWCELWRSEEWLTQIVGDVRVRELRMLAEVHDFRLVRAELDLLTAAIDGLRVAVCAPVRPMPPAQARDLLRSASSAALGSAA
jgi:AcrR family transcriptional regulator